MARSRTSLRQHIIWLSTMVLQVPCHRRLETGFDAAVARRLVRTNWVRTFAWTALGVGTFMVLWIIYAMVFAYR